MPNKNNKKTEENNTNVSKKTICHDETKCFDFVPWFDLECIKQGSGGSVNSTVEVKKMLDDPQKRKEKLLTSKQIHSYNSIDNAILPDDDNVFEKSLDTRLQELSDHEKAEKLRKMLGYID